MTSPVCLGQSGLGARSGTLRLLRFEHDIEYPMHSGDIEQKLNSGRGVEESDSPVAAGRRFVKGDQGAQTATIEKVGLRQVDLDGSTMLRKGGANFLSEGLAVISSEFEDILDAERITIYD
jgi:hypothetical protein